MDAHPATLLMTQVLVAIFVVLLQVSTLLAQEAPGKTTPPPMRATETLPAGPDGTQSASPGAPQSAAAPKVSGNATPQTTQKDTPQAGRGAGAHASRLLAGSLRRRALQRVDALRERWHRRHPDRRANQDRQRERRAGAGPAQSRLQRAQRQAGDPLRARAQARRHRGQRAGVGDPGPDLPRRARSTPTTTRSTSACRRCGPAMCWSIASSAPSPARPRRGSSGPASTSRRRASCSTSSLEINVPKERQIKLKTKPGYDPKITDEGDRRIYRWTHSHLKDDDHDAKAKKKKPSKADDDIPSVATDHLQELGRAGCLVRRAGARAARARRHRESPSRDAGQRQDRRHGEGQGALRLRLTQYPLCEPVVRPGTLFSRTPPARCWPTATAIAKTRTLCWPRCSTPRDFIRRSVLIGSHMKLDPDVPSPSQFDHVITRVPVDGKEIWLDSTPGVAPFRMLSFTAARQSRRWRSLPTATPSWCWTPADAAVPSVRPHQPSSGQRQRYRQADRAHHHERRAATTEMLLRYGMRRMPSNHWKDIFEYVLQRAKLQRRRDHRI